MSPCLRQFSPYTGLQRLILHDCIVSSGLPSWVSHLRLVNCALFPSALVKIRDGNLSDIELDRVTLKESGTLTLIPDRVTKLKMRNCAFDADAVVPLRGGHPTFRLRELDISGDVDTPRSAMVTLFKKFDYVKVVNVSRCRLDIVDLATKIFTDPEEFLAANTEMANGHIKQLAAGVKKINMKQCQQLNDDTPSTIAAHLKSLEELNIRGNGSISDYGMRKLTEIRSRLNQLNIEMTQASVTTIAELRKNFPACNVLIAGLHDVALT